AAPSRYRCLRAGRSRAPGRGAGAPHRGAHPRHAAPRVGPSRLAPARHRHSDQGEALMPFDGDRFACNPLSVAKLDRVIALIDTPEKWCQGSVVDYDGRMCIVGAISHLGRDSVAPLGLLGPVAHAIAEITGR